MVVDPDGALPQVPTGVLVDTVDNDEDAAAQTGFVRHPEAGNSLDASATREDAAVPLLAQDALNLAGIQRGPVQGWRVRREARGVGGNDQLDSIAVEDGH